MISGRIFGLKTADVSLGVGSIFTDADGSRWIVHRVDVSYPGGEKCTQCTLCRIPDGDNEEGMGRRWLWRDQPNRLVTAWGDEGLPS